jgi:3-phosphoshikimate 1-carboxyvinyltransferase
MPAEDTVTIQAARNVRGSLRLPGDKSISHRYAMLAAIAEGTSRLENFSMGVDCASTLHCLRELGCQWERDTQSGAIQIQGCGPVLRPPARSLDCGNSGSTMRMLSGILAAQSFASTLTGDASLSRRPMARVIEPLGRMGARIEAADGNRPPLTIHGGRLKGIQYRLPVASAQVKSALLFGGLLAEGETCIEEPVRTRDHGEHALRAFGAQVRQDGNSISVAGGQKLRGIEALVPGDISSAAFFLCAAALFQGSQLTITNLLLNPTRARLLDVLIRMGLRISVAEIAEHHGELAGTIQVEGGELRGTTIIGAESAALIDELPVLAAIAPYTRDGMEIRDARELRVKESDRIVAVAQDLRAMGAEVEEREDGWKIAGGQKLHGAEIGSFDDHRIVMAFAVAALRAEGKTQLHGADAAAISYPSFLDDLASVAER